MSYGVVLSMAACGGASSDPGLEAWMRVKGMSYVAGGLTEAEEGPSPVVQDLSSPFKVARGAAVASFSGSLSPDGVTVLVGLRGDAGHWILPVSGGDPFQGIPSSFMGSASFAAAAPVGSQTLLARGVAADGRLGPVAQAALTITDAPGVTGALVISLEWDSEADLDLRVTAPDTRGMPVEIWTKRRLAIAKTPPGEPKPDAAEIATAGELDFDSNAQCVIDGRRQENVVWKQMPPSGAYAVRVDAFSLCGEVAARWRARAFLNGNLIGQSQGEMTDWDTRGDHGAGAGLGVLSFNL